jgi:hypothetical protein
MNREKLYKLQGCLAILLILVATVQFALEAQGADFLKVAIAPFGMISLLLFAFFLYNRQRVDLDDEESFGRKRTLASFGILLIAGAVVIAVTTILGDLTNTLDRVIFSFSILVGVVIFLYEKVRNLRTMATLTGVAEGITILLIFFR